MARLPKEYWKIGFTNERQEYNWTESYRKLNNGYRWEVESALKNLIHFEYPWEEYPSIKCDECRDDIYILNVSHSGIGPKIVQIMVMFDKQNCAVVPLDCELL